MAHPQHAQVNGDRGKLLWHAPKCTGLSPEKLIEAERQEQTLLAARLGHNGPPTDDPRAARRAELVAAITAWVQATKEARLTKSLSREELGALDRADRLRVLRVSRLEQLIRKTRNNATEDCLEAVIELVTATCDNALGASYLSTARIAEVVGRHVNSIRNAIDRGVETGRLRRECRPGASDYVWPVVSAELSGAQAWDFIAALSTERKPGRPAKHPQSKGVGVFDSEKAPQPDGMAGFETGSPPHAKGVGVSNPPQVWGVGGLEKPPQANPKTLTPQGVADLH